MKAVVRAFLLLIACVAIVAGVAAFTIVNRGLSTAVPPTRASWGLVHFLRRLPRLSPGDLAEMEALNPRRPQQFREEEEARRFLAGEDSLGTRRP